MKPNILFIQSDEHGFRHMGYVPKEKGGEDVSTPNFDKLAKTSCVFNSAYCQMPLCTPSRISMFSGMTADKCGAWGNESIFDPKLPNMAKTFQAGGYETCLIGKYHLGGSNQLGGFMHRPYGDLTGKCGHQWEPLTVKGCPMDVRTKFAGVTDIPESLMQEAAVCNETLAFLREHTHEKPDKPWFVCAGFSRPHFPLNAPKRHLDKYWPDNISEPLVGKTGDAYDHPMSVGMREGFQADNIEYDEMMKARAAYFANVTYLDEIIGDFLVRLENANLLENTIIVYVSDHGEMAGEHGVWWKNGWYEACTRVPMIISLPNQRYGNTKNQSIDIPVGLYDLFPTLCSLSGIDYPEQLDGIDLSNSVNDGLEPAIRPIVCDALMPRWGDGCEFRMLRYGDYKYIAFKGCDNLMFNVIKDPFEQYNIINSSDKDIIATASYLEEYINKTMDFDKTAQKQIKWTAQLEKDYPLILDREINDATNLYLMHSNQLVSGDCALYDPKSYSKDVSKTFMHNDKK